MSAEVPFKDFLIFLYNSVSPHPPPAREASPIRSIQRIQTSQTSPPRSTKKPLTSPSLNNGNEEHLHESLTRTQSQKTMSLSQGKKRNSKISTKPLPPLQKGHSLSDYVDYDYDLESEEDSGHRGHMIIIHHEVHSNSKPENDDHNIPIHDEHTTIQETTRPQTESGDSQPLSKSKSVASISKSNKSSKFSKGSSTSNSNTDSFKNKDKSITSPLKSGSGSDENITKDEKCTNAKSLPSLPPDQEHDLKQSHSAIPHLSNSVSKSKSSKSFKSSKSTKSTSFRDELGDYNHNAPINETEDITTKPNSNTATIHSPVLIASDGIDKDKDYDTHINFKEDQHQHPPNHLKDATHLCVNEDNDLSFFKNFSATTRSKSSLAAFIFAKDDNQYCCFHHQHHHHHLYGFHHEHHHHQEIYCNYFLSKRLSRSTPIALDIITETSTTTTQQKEDSTEERFDSGNLDDYNSPTRHEDCHYTVMILDRSESASGPQHDFEGKQDDIDKHMAPEITTPTQKNQSAISYQSKMQVIDFHQDQDVDNVDNLESVQELHNLDDLDAIRIKSMSQRSILGSNSKSSPALNSAKDFQFQTATSPRRINTSNGVPKRNKRNETTTTVTVTMDAKSLFLDTVYVNLKQDIDNAETSIQVFY